jgi:hypothetical protein
MQFYDSLLGHDLADIFNSRGHRCKEIEEINLHNYILFAGDNVGVGWGTPVEETYPYLVSKALSSDYYNLSIFNGGLESLRYNLITWYHKIPQKPRAIIISNEFLNSFIVSDLNNTTFLPCNLDDEKVQAVLDAGNTTNYFLTRQYFTDKLISNLIKTPIYQIEFKDRTPAFTNNVINLKHEGDIFDHNEISKLIVAEFNKTKRQIRP